MWLLFACGSALFAGVTAVLAKIGMQHINSTIATALRTIIVLLFSWLMVLLTGAFSGIGSISGKTLVFLLLSGCATGASWLCYFKALQLGDVSQVAPIDKSSTILTMLLAFLLLGESLTWLKLCCMLLIGAGTFLMLPKHSGDSKTVSSKKGWLFYAVLSAVFASLTSILGKVGIQDIDSNLGTAIRTCVVLVMAWVMVFVTGQQHSMHGLNRKDLLFLGLSGLTTGLSWLCYYRALQDGPASVVVPIDKLSILVTVAFSGLVERAAGSAFRHWIGFADGRHPFAGTMTQAYITHKRASVSSKPMPFFLMVTNHFFSSSSITPSAGLWSIAPTIRCGTYGSSRYATSSSVNRTASAPAASSR